MSKKSKNKILIIFIYFISFFIFELIIGVGGIEKTLQYCAETGNVTPLNICADSRSRCISFYICINHSNSLCIL